MPLTEFQKAVLAALAGHRNPDSHAGGGAAINRADASPRYSADLDFFHDTEASVKVSAEADAAALTGQGFTIEWLMREASMQKAIVKRETDEVRLEWCHDSAFRFFPVQSDPDFGYCLHPADVAVNKALALAGRSEIRDFLDILYLHDNYLSLGALCWAACGKDPGFTPPMMLNWAKRHMRFQEEHLSKERLVNPPRLTELKTAWLNIAESAEEWFSRMPPADLGCLYLRPDFVPFAPEPGQPEFTRAIRHFGSVGGAWPRLSSH